VLFHGEPGEIELVADPWVNDPETEWLVQEYEPKVFGRAFLSNTEDAEDLVFVSRPTEENSVDKS
jgi:hypothetical protein